MAAPKLKRMGPKPLPEVDPPLPPATATAPSTPLPSSPAQASTGAKKRKKKKGKGKGVATLYDGDDEDDEDLPELEPATIPNGRGRSASHTGLSPELESVHLSTTASLSASVAAAARFNPAAVAEAELLATADHLARSMEADPEGMSSDEYWASFPDHLRNFVRHTYSQLSSPGDEDEKTQAMYNIAQQIHSGAGVNFTAQATLKGLTRTATTRYGPPGAFPTFDPSIFTDPAFTQAMERAAAANGFQSPSAQDVHAVADVVLNEYADEEGEYYSDDEGEDEDDGHHPTEAQLTVSYEERLAADDRHDAELVYDDSPARTKKKKKKKKKAAGNIAGAGRSAGALRASECLCHRPIFRIMCLSADVRAPSLMLHAPSFILLAEW